jgi:hypothetical protein
VVAYIDANDQRKLIAELEGVQSALQDVFAKLKPLDSRDERVTRTEAALAAVTRLLWTMTSGPGGVGPPMPVTAILRPFRSPYLVKKEAQGA